MVRVCYWICYTLYASHFQHIRYLFAQFATEIFLHLCCVFGFSVGHAAKITLIQCHVSWNVRDGNGKSQFKVCSSEMLVITLLGMSFSTSVAVSYNNIGHSFENCMPYSIFSFIHSRCDMSLSICLSVFLCPSVCVGHYSGA